MIKIGITGGIGSGKSVVGEILKLYNIPLYDADREAKKLNDTSDVVRNKLIFHFGNDIYIDGLLNRKKFAELIFNNKENLKIANSIIHPELAKHFLEWCKNYTNSPIVAIEAAILIEAGFIHYIDKLITVYSPEQLRIERVIKRDDTSLDNVKSRINNQLPEKDRIKLSNYIIRNDGKHSLLRQVSEIINNIEL